MAATPYDRNHQDVAISYVIPWSGVV